MNDIIKTIENFRELKEGWRNSGVPIPEKAIKVALKFANAIDEKTDLLKTMRVFPDSHGVIRFECEHFIGYIHIEIDIEVIIFYINYFDGGKYRQSFSYIEKAIDKFVEEVDKIDKDKEIDYIKNTLAMIGQLESHKTNPEYIEAVNYYFKMRDN